MSTMKIFTDSPLLWQVGFQSPATPVMEGIFGLHNLIMIYVIVVFTVVIWFLTRSLYLFNASKNLIPLEFNHDPVIETIWTIAPAFILISIAMPSFSLLYSMDDVIDPALTVKITGHQWYWSYELNVFRVDSLVDYFNIPMPRAKDWKLDPKLVKLNKFLVEQKKQEVLNSGFYKYLKPFIKNPKPKIPKTMLYDFSEEVYKAKARVELSKAEVKAFDKALVARYFPPMSAKALAPFIDVDKMVREQLAYEKVYDRLGPNLSKTIPHRPKVKASFFALFEFITEESRLRNSIQWISPPIKFDSYMIPDGELPFGGLRLLEVDNPLVLPINTHVKLLITSADVIHSWAVPALGVKVDAVPGRLNQSFLFIKRTGTFYGQCSELCGVNHGFMPIVVKAVTYEEFTKWALHKSSAMKLSDIVNSPDWDIKIN